MHQRNTESRAVRGGYSAPRGSLICLGFCTSGQTQISFPSSYIIARYTSHVKPKRCQLDPRESVKPVESLQLKSRRAAKGFGRGFQIRS